jgi:TPR repeat protein
MNRNILTLFVLFLAGCSAVPGDAAFRAGKFTSALVLYEKEYQSGNTAAGMRLAEMFSKGIGTPKNEQRAFSIFIDLAGKDVTHAMHNVGVAYEYGQGVAVDFQKAYSWYSRAASKGHIWSTYNLGTLHANQRVMPADDIEGLTLLLLARAGVAGDSSAANFIVRDMGGHIEKLSRRMDQHSIVLSHERAATRSIPTMQ